MSLIQEEIKAAIARDFTHREEDQEKTEHESGSRTGKLGLNFTRWQVS